MKRQLASSVRFLLLLTTAALLAGCQTSAQTGSLVGAGIGALAGQAIGGNTGGTLIGAAAGAGIGYLIGGEQDKAEARDAESRFRTLPPRGDRETP